MVFFIFFFQITLLEYDSPSSASYFSIARGANKPNSTCRKNRMDYGFTISNCLNFEPFLKLILQVTKDHHSITCRNQESVCSKD